MRYTMVRKKELHLIVTAVAGGTVAVHEAEKYPAGGAENEIKA